MRIDSHQHFWYYNPEREGWITDQMSRIRKDFLPQDLKLVLEKNSMDGCILVQADDSEEETVRLLDFAADAPFVKAVVGWVDLTGDDCRERLEYYTRNEIFKGIRHTLQGVPEAVVLQDSFQRGIQLLSEFGLTYDLLIFQDQLPVATKLVKNHPHQAFVLDHMAKVQITSKVNPGWEAGIKELAKQENIFCKLSGFLVETEGLKWEPKSFDPFFEVVWNAFGEDRLMYGSDWPVCLAAGSYEDTVKLVESFFARKGSRALEKIMGKNAQRFYNL